jgi:hypothetical protein
MDEPAYKRCEMLLIGSSRADANGAKASNLEM